MSQKNLSKSVSVRIELANRFFFRLYQSANMLHKTGSRAVQAEGLTTQQWAVMGALSRPSAAAGLAVSELSRYLMVSRQNLSGVLKRMETAGHIRITPDVRDRRARIIRITEAGADVWHNRALPKIHAYYEQALDEFSTGDITHALHYMMKLLENMERLDEGAPDEAD